MARLGSFDIDIIAVENFDIDMLSCGWVDRDVVPCSAPIPPTPPPRPPRPPPRPRPSPSGGGAAFFPSVPYCPPDWLLKYLVPYDECEDLCPDEGAEVAVADFALMHVVVVKALADGVVETKIENNRKSIVLTGDDGTRYWYADVGAISIASGSRVRAGQAIARTNLGVASIPSVTPTGGSTGPRHGLLSAAGAVPALLPASAPASPPSTPSPPSAPSPEPKKPRPSQVVFIEAPLESEPPPQPQKRFAVLVPIGQPPPPPPPDELRAPSGQGWAIVRAIAPVAAVAVLLFALASFDSRPRPRPRPRTRRKRRLR